MAMIDQAPDTSLAGRWKQAARALKQQTLALYLAYKDPRTPWYAKLWAGLVLAYAFSPLDLIPDFIPVLGYLDDLILVPAGLSLAIKLIPSDVMAASRATAAETMDTEGPTNWGAAIVIIAIWLLLAWLAIRWLAALL